MRKTCFRIIVLASLLVSASVQLQAEKVAFAKLSGSKLTFYYLDKELGDMMWDVSDTKNSEPGWYEYRSQIQTVSFASNFSKARPKSCNQWFMGCRNLTKIENLENLNTSEVTTMRRMFESCSSLKTIDVSSFATDNVITMYGMFRGCSLIKSVNVKSFNTEKVTSMYRMFSGCENLTTIKGLQYLNTAAVKSMGYMFHGCKNLTELELRSFNTAKVTSMSCMFYGCTNLSSITVSGGFTTASLSSGNDESMFGDCTALVGGKGTTFQSAYIDKTYARVDMGKSAPGYLTGEYYAVITPFGSYNVLTCQYGAKPMENAWDALNLGNDNGWKADENKVSMVYFDPSYADARPMSLARWFRECQSLVTVGGLENLNMSEVTDMSEMFYDCDGLFVLDLSVLDTRNVTKMDYMFISCNSLRTIYVGKNWSTKNVTSSDAMFAQCSRLLGGKGTTFDSGQVDATYAHVDAAPANPGYLTDIADQTFAGDANGDGTVSITDAVNIVDTILGNPPKGFRWAAGDVNFDSKITITDAVGVVDVILGK